jgi:hypothetical protein
VTIAAATIKEVLKGIPRDTQFNGLLEYADVAVNESNHVNFTTNDGQRERHIACREYARAYIPYQHLLGKALVSAAKTKGPRVVLNRKRLEQLLKTLDSITPDPSGESPVFIEFTGDNDVILRTVNPKTGQKALALMTSYKAAEGKWPKVDKWELKFLMEGAKAHDENKNADKSPR